MLIKRVIMLNDWATNGNGAKDITEALKSPARRSSFALSEFGRRLNGHHRGPARHRINVVGHLRRLHNTAESRSHASINASRQFGLTTKLIAIHL